MMAEQILIIDEDSEHAENLAASLGKFQYDVTVAVSDTEIVDLLKNAHWDVILGNPLISEQIAGMVETISRTSPMTQVIVYARPEVLDQAMDRFGLKVLNYLDIPLNNKALDLSLKRARKSRMQVRRNYTYTERLGDFHHEHILYARLFDMVPCYISVQDRNLRLTAGNRRFRDHFGNRIGGYCYQIYKQRKTPCENCPVIQTFDDGKTHSTEEIVTSLNGRQYNVLTHTAPIRNEKGDITRVMEMSIDITQIRQLQDHLASLGLMLGSMSHGVKGMLTALDGGVYHLETGLKQKDDARISKAVTQVRMMTGRIRKMVLDVLYYAKSRELQYVTMDVSDLVRNVTGNIEPLMLKHNIRLQVSVAQDPGTLELDPTWMEAALMNFMENASDACVSDTGKSGHMVDFVVEEPDPDTIGFKISDNGTGMDQETCDKMFTLFFSSKGSKGTGLGLFIAHRVIHQHGGSVTVESEPGRGTQFRVLLPRKRPEILKDTDMGN